MWILDSYVQISQERFVRKSQNLVNYGQVFKRDLSEKERGEEKEDYYIIITRANSEFRRELTNIYPCLVFPLFDSV